MCWQNERTYEDCLRVKKLVSEMRAAAARAAEENPWTTAKRAKKKEKKKNAKARAKVRIAAVDTEFLGKGYVCMKLSSIVLHDNPRVLDRSTQHVKN